MKLYRSTGRPPAYAGQKWKRNVQCVQCASSSPNSCRNRIGERLSSALRCCRGKLSARGVPLRCWLRNSGPGIAGGSTQEALRSRTHRCAVRMFGRVNEKKLFAMQAVTRETHVRDALELEPRVTACCSLVLPVVSFYCLDGREAPKGTSASRIMGTLTTRHTQWFARGKGANVKLDIEIHR